MNAVCPQQFNFESIPRRPPHPNMRFRPSSAPPKPVGDGALAATLNAYSKKTYSSPLAISSCDEQEAGNTVSLRQTTNGSLVTGTVAHVFTSSPCKVASSTGSPTHLIPSFLKVSALPRSTTPLPTASEHTATSSSNFASSPPSNTPLYALSPAQVSTSATSANPNTSSPHGLTSNSLQRHTSSLLPTSSPSIPTGIMSSLTTAIPPDLNLSTTTSTAANRLRPSRPLSAAVSNHSSGRQGDRG